jgi:hypothetical protein
MAMSVNSVGASSFLNFPTPSANNAPRVTRTDENGGEKSAKEDASEIGDVSGAVAGAAEEKDDAKLAKIKEEIKRAPVLPSTEKIVARYGITTAQAEKVLAEACLEVATNAGGTPEQVTKTANGLYLMAEISDSDVVEVLDVAKLLKEAAAKKEEASAKKIAEENDITLEQAQEIIAQGETNEDDTASSGAIAGASVNGDLAASSTYSVSNGGSSGSHAVSISNRSLSCVSTVSYRA